MIYDEVQIDGFDIRVVRDARLTEISLVEYGAVEEAYCRLVDHDGDRGTLVRSGAADQLDRAMQQMRDRLYEAFA
jgi:hypothetical protein